MSPSAPRFWNIPALDQACRELARVARHEVLVGVPFEQDTRVGRLTSRSCSRISPPWGHVNTFTQAKLERLFAGWRPVEVSFVGTVRAGTNRLSTWLLDRAGNPWGVYDQEEPCLHCGSKLVPPITRSHSSRVCSNLAALVQSRKSRSFVLTPTGFTFQRPCGHAGESAAVESACGHAELRPIKAEARHQRKNALGVGPQRR